MHELCKVDVQSLLLLWLKLGIGSTLPFGEFSVKLVYVTDLIFIRRPMLSLLEAASAA